MFCAGRCARVIRVETSQVCESESGDLANEGTSS